MISRVVLLGMTNVSGKVTERIIRLVLFSITFF